jgi:hypothetical protein
MMDPVTAVGLVANIIQFVDLGTKVVSTLREIRGSASGQTESNRRTREMAVVMRNLSDKLADPKHAPRTDVQKDLCQLARECSDLSQQILDIVHKTTFAKSRSMFRSSKATLSTLWHDREKEELEKRLAQCRGQLGVLLTYATSEDTKEQLAALATDSKNQGMVFRTLKDDVKKLNEGVTIAYFDEKAQQQIQSLLKLPTAIRDSMIQQTITRALAFPEMHSRFHTVDTARFQTFAWMFEENPDVRLVRPLAARRLFIHWLSHEGAVFHVAGKLGSAKSTLIKFLVQHPRTSAELQEWAGMYTSVVYV